MPRKCTICHHVEREEIDAALVRRDTFRNIAAQHGVSTSALVRHSDDHLPKALLKARDVAEVAAADNILGQMQDLRERALAILTKAEDSDDLRTALGAIRECCRCIELLGRLAGELQDGATVNIIISPEWKALQTAILGALEPYTDARLAVAGALADMRSDHEPGHA